MVELDDGSVLITADRVDIRGILEENDFEFLEEENSIIVLDSFEELVEEFSEYDFAVTKYDGSAEELLEGSAKRKVVVRRGRRKIIFQCGPGQKKVGPRRCVKRPSRDLMKMKRRARRAARKARRKRSQANRRRKVSLRKRPHKTRKHKK